MHNTENKEESKLHTKPCRRCGVFVTSLKKAIYTPESVQKKYAFICGKCFTDQEKHEMDQDVREAYSNGFRPF